MDFPLKDGFLLGVATAPTQIEGGELEHSWNDWAQRGHISDGTSPARANDHIRFWKQDVDLMHSLGVRVYRMGIEWARVEPREGVFDDEALAFYYELLSYINRRGIKPLVTLHHFTNPMWFERMGGFTKAENIDIFLRYVGHVIDSLGDLACEYVTINEPNVYAVNSYYYGIWPPGEKSMKESMAVISVMAGCHIKAYGLIHAKRREMGYDDTKVGFAHHMRVFHPKSRYNPRHLLNTAILNAMFQSVMARAFLTGRFLPPLKKPCLLRPGAYADFLGLNYYTRSTVSGFGDGVLDGAPRNDLGWEIYPEGLEICARHLYRVLPRPIYVTENGVCDNQDRFRCRYICEHLEVISRSTLPFERYYHWCFCDNFEWVEGESARFGLVHVDYPTQTRSIKKSGSFFSEVSSNGGVTGEIFAKYVESEQYRCR